MAMSGDLTGVRWWITECPDCGLAAEAVDEGQVESTDGPIGLVRVGCVSRHWFLMPADRLRTGGGAADEEPVVRRPARR